MLPESLENFPVFFSDNEKNLLKGTQLKHLIDLELLNIEGDYHLICKEVEGFQ